MPTLMRHPWPNILPFAFISLLIFSVRFAQVKAVRNNDFSHYEYKYDLTILVILLLLVKENGEFGLLNYHSNLRR